MFILDQSPAVDLELTLEYVVDGGQREKVNLRLTVKRFKESELQSFMESSESFAAFLRRVVVGWKGLKKADGTEVDFSPERLDVVLDIVGMPAQMFSKLREALSVSLAKN